MKECTGLNCSIGIATSRMVAKVSSDQAKPNGVLWIQPGLEAEFLARLDVRRIPGVGGVSEQRLAQMGIRKVGDLARLDEGFLRRKFGQFGLALAGKARGMDAGSWFDGEIGDHEDAKSISHEHTFYEDTADIDQLESTLARLTEKVARRLREQGFYGRTVHLKLRYSDFTTLTRSHTLPRATQLDHELIAHSREMFKKAWKRGEKVRLLGMGVSGFDTTEGQLSLVEGEKNERAKAALAAVDRIRDKFGEKSVKLAVGLSGDHAERVHENPVGMPGKAPRKTSG
jgi:DNA polymerase-4